MGVLASSDIPDELPPLVVSLDDHLDLGVEVAVGEADHQALGGEQDAPDDLEQVLGPGGGGGSLDGDEVTDTKDRHHDDQRLTQLIRDPGLLVPPYLRCFPVFSVMIQSGVFS